MCGISAGCGHQHQLCTLQLLQPVLISSTRDAWLWLLLAGGKQSVCAMAWKEIGTSLLAILITLAEGGYEVYYFKLHRGFVGGKIAHLTSPIATAWAIKKTNKQKITLDELQYKHTHI